MKVSLSQVLKHQPHVSTDFTKIRLPDNIELTHIPDWAHTIISDHTDASNIRVTQDNDWIDQDYNRPVIYRSYHSDYGYSTDCHA